MLTWWVKAATLGAAFNQLQTYKAQVPALFRANAVLVTTDGIQARIGSLTADLERFMPWRTTDGADVAPILAAIRRLRAPPSCA